ncbi:LEAF RUST 10 DISEASE-RESISTANCE LOCUS RECEPTOR-LIKE PROTEIN KINASE-like 1.3 [Linum grandiflorum]
MHPLLLLLLLFLSSSAAASLPPDGNLSGCNETFSCGHIANIDFPFTGGQRPHYCGLPGFNLTCHNSSITLLTINSLNYTVLHIDNSNPTLTLSRSDFYDSSSSSAGCTHLHRNSSLSGSKFTLSPNSHTLTLFYSCNYTSSAYDYNPPNLFYCSDDDDGGRLRAGFYMVGEVPDVAESIQSQCGSSVTVPISGAYSGIMSNGSLLAPALRAGFNVNYSDPMSDDCFGCFFEKHGHCGFDDDSGESICICGDRLCPVDAVSRSKAEAKAGDFAAAEETVTEGRGGGRSDGGRGSGYGVGSGGGGNRYACGGGGRKSKATAIAIGVSAGGGTVAAIAICFWFLISRRRKRKAAQIMSKDSSTPPSSTAKTRTTRTTKYSNTTSSSYTTSMSDIEKGGPGSTYFGVQVFTYDELDEATDSFDASKELGDGGFGTVYYGELDDGRAVAVKRLYENNMRRTEQFMNEIEILAKLRHKNLVTLYGCTSRHSRELVLVYEYISNGTVADHLHGNRRTQSGSSMMTWRVRMNIAIQTADALSFLHASDVIHRDVKTNNVLLDENFNVKVADFGLSRLFPLHVTHVSTAPQGTPGYVDPEYYQCYQLTDKSDVYSFGVVLMELITSLQAVDTCRHRHDINLANMAVSRIQNQQLGEMVDPSLGFETDYAVRRMVTSVAELAFRCLQQERDMRPTMNEVVGILKRIEKENELGSVQKAEVVDIGKDDVEQGDEDDVMG